MVTEGDFGRNLRFALQQRGHTQTSLARELHIGPENITRWIKSGQPPPLRVREIEKLLTVTNLLSPHDVFLRTNNFLAIFPFMRPVRLYEDNANQLGEFERVVDECLAQTKEYVYYARLSQTIERDGEDGQLPELRNKAFTEKLIRKEISFFRIDVFFSVGRFLQSLKTAKRLRGTRYLSRFYIKPPVSYPVINFRSYDNERFLVGGFYDEPLLDKLSLCINGKQPLRDFFQDYWAAVWDTRKSRLFWDAELKGAEEIAMSLGITPDVWVKIKSALLDDDEKAWDSVSASAIKSSKG